MKRLLLKFLHLVEMKIILYKSSAVYYNFQQKAETGPEVQYVMINIYLDKLGENDAHKIEHELRNFIGQTGEVKGDYQNPALKIDIRIVKDSAGAKNVRDIEAFLKNDMKNKGVELLVDKPDGNSIKGSKPGGILDRVWW